MFFFFSPVHRKKISVFVSAHQDDWQLFMGKQFYEAAKDTNQKIILLVTTSGATTVQFTNARDRGVLASVQSLAAFRMCKIPSRFDFTEIAQHRIQYFAYRNVKIIFLHLPDGNIDGKGFKEWNFESLEKLQTGENKSIHTTDSLNLFTTWADLTSTLTTCLQTEIDFQNQQVYLHLPDTSSALNHNDHADHICSSKLVLAATRKNQCQFFFYSQYNNEYLPANLSVTDSTIQDDLFEAYDKEVTHQMGFCTTCYTDLYHRLCARNYSRKAPSRKME